MPGQAVRVIGGRRVATSARATPKKKLQEVWTPYDTPQNRKQIKHNQFCQLYHQLKRAVSPEQLQAAEQAFRKNRDLKPIKALQDSITGGDPNTRASTKRLFQKAGAISRATIAALQGPPEPADNTPTDLQSWLAFRAPPAKTLADTPFTIEQALDKLKI